MKKIHHFIYDVNISIDSGVVFSIKDEALVHQVRDVLRLKNGERICLVNPSSHKKYLVRIVKSMPDSISVSFESEESGDIFFHKPAVHMYVSILKKDLFELVAQKLTEVGCFSLTGLLCDHTVKTNINEERVKKISIEATEQSQQNRLMEYRGISDFPVALERACVDSELVVFFDITETNSRSFFASSGVSYASASLFIGPEGGWSDHERSHVLELQKKYSHLIIASLGTSVLKAETAATVAAYCACELG